MYKQSYDTRLQIYILPPIPDETSNGYGVRNIKSVTVSIWPYKYAFNTLCSKSHIPISPDYVPVAIMEKYGSVLIITMSLCAPVTLRNGSQSVNKSL